MRVDRRPSLGYKVELAANNDAIKVEKLLTRLLKIGAILVIFLVVSYSLVLLTIEAVLNKGDMNNIESFQTVDNEYKRIVEETIPTVQKWYQGLQNKKDLLGMEQEGIQWPKTGEKDHSDTCIDTFYDTLYTAVPQTSPGLVQLVLQGMGLAKSRLVQKHLKDLLTAKKDISSMYTQSSDCLKSNVAIAEIACAVKGHMGSVGNSSKDYLEYVVNEAAVLDALTYAMYDDLALVAEVAQNLVEQQETRKTYMVAMAKSKEAQEFMVNKYDGIIYSLQSSIPHLAANDNSKSSADILTLQNNILLAVKLDIANGHDANARVGLALAANVGFGPEIEDKHRKWALGKDWANAYISWNLAFVMSLQYASVTKLLIPSVACTANNGKGEYFVHQRVLSLAAKLLTPGNLEFHNISSSVDPQKISNIKSTYQSIKAGPSSPSDKTAQDKLLQLPGEANLHNVVLTNPSPDRVEKMLYALCGNFCHGLDQWSISQTSPTDHIGDDDYPVFITLVIWATVIIQGLGLELAVWLQFLQPGWNDRLQTHWKIAQFLFPLLAVISLGLAAHQDYMALLTLVVGLFKFGFPETLLYMHSALYPRDKNAAWSRVSDFLNGLGTILHHSSASLGICVLLTGVVEPSRFVIDPILILIMQHWFILLKYLHEPTYIGVELVLEIWFEWSIISQMEPYVYMYHWMVPMAASGMLVAHWIYLIAAFIELFTEKEVVSVYEGAKWRSVALTSTTKSEEYHAASAKGIVMLRSPLDELDGTSQLDTSSSSCRVFYDV